jgi:hypothetical protein
VRALIAAGLILIGGGLLAPRLTFAQSLLRGPESPEWIQTSRGPEYEASVGSAISAKQRSMIDSGFSTFTELVVTYAGDPDEKALLRLICAVKFDTWEERYEINRFENETTNHVMTTQLVRDYGIFARECLTIRLPTSVLNAAERADMVLRATLRVKQASAEEAQRAKEWLVRQQSGMIQNLFSHMIGELSLTEVINLELRVPTPRAGGG